MVFNSPRYKKYTFIKRKLQIADNALVLLADLFAYIFSLLTDSVVAWFDPLNLHIPLSIDTLEVFRWFHVCGSIERTFDFVRFSISEAQWKRHRSRSLKFYKYLGSLGLT